MEREIGVHGKKGKELIHYLFFIFFFLIDGCLRNAIQVSLATLCNPSSTFLLIDLNDSNFLKCLEDATVNLAGGVNVVRWP
jgi:hypothetical protein